MWDECNCALVWAFFGIAFLWDWNENWSFPVLCPLLSFPNLLAYWWSTLTVSFLGFGIAVVEFHPSQALFIVMLLKAPLTSHSGMSGSRWVTTDTYLPEIDAVHSTELSKKIQTFLPNFCWLNKRCPTYELWVKFYWGKMRTAAQEATSQIALRDCSKAAMGESQYIRFRWRGSSMPWSTHFTKGFLLVMRIWCHHEGI